MVGFHAFRSAVGLKALLHRYMVLLLLCLCLSSLWIWYVHSELMEAYECVNLCLFVSCLAYCLV